MSWDVYARIQTIRKSQPPAEALAALVAEESTVEGFAPLLNIKAQVLIDLDRPQDAIRVAQQALKVNDKHFWTFCTLASAFRRLRRLDDAVSAAREAADRAPANAMLKAKLASLLAESGKLDAALAVIEEAIAIDASQAGFHKDRSVLLERLSPRGRCLEEITQAALREIRQRAPKAGTAITVCLDYRPGPGALQIAGRTCLVNLYPFCELALSDTAAKAHFARLLWRIRDTLGADWTGNINLSPLNDALIDALQFNAPRSLQIFDRINSLICAYTQCCLNEGGTVAQHMPDCWPPLTDWSHGLLVRYGNVELRVIQNYLEDRAGLHEQLARIMREPAREDLFYAKPARKNWLSAEDANWNLRKLFTNAGFYTDPCDPHPSLDAWAEKYLSGLTRGQLLRPPAGHYPNFFKTQQILYNASGRKVRYVAFPDAARFYALLAGRKILFVTPYSQAITGLFQSRRLFSLYRDIEVPPFTLATITAPMSIYPNRPGTSWLETYISLLARVMSEIADKDIDLFFASCGCYGVPLCQDVHRKCGIPAAYFGNHLNTLFGVRQKCSRNFLPDRVNTSSWAESNLSKIFRNIDRVDGGRYT